MRIAPAAVLLATLPLAAFAAGTEKPVATPTTTDCPDGQVYDVDAKSCIDAAETKLRDTDRLDAARELASFHRADSALMVLATLDAPDTADALTVRGYATRKAGDIAGGLSLYDIALAIDPDHAQARSYLGQALAEGGDMDGARAQLDAIRLVGGRGTWPEISLALAITGAGDY